MVLVDLATVAFALSLINTILIILIINKIKLQLTKQDILTILSVVAQILAIIKSNPNNQEEIKNLLNNLQSLLNDLETKYK